MSPKMKKAAMAGTGFLFIYEALTHIVSTLEIGVLGGLAGGAFYLFGSEKHKLVAKDMYRNAKENVIKALK